MKAEATTIREDLPFSKRLLDMHREFSGATRERKLELAQELAALFASEHDATDYSATDDYHQYFEEYFQAKLRYEQESLRLARLAANLISVLLEKSADEDEASAVILKTN